MKIQFFETINISSQHCRSLFFIQILLYFASKSGHKLRLHHVICGAACVQKNITMADLCQLWDTCDGENYFYF